MGLDITAYEKIGARLVNQDEDDPQGAHIYAWPDPFPGAVRCELETGWYESLGREVHFRAGSYGGYNRWREQLAAMVSVEPEKLWHDHRPGPFVELINFADNEGALQGAVTVKLRDDFRAYQTRAEEFSATLSGPDAGWFIDRYNDWRMAFELAADGGAVRLH